MRFIHKGLIFASLFSFRVSEMRANIHPNYKTLKVTCSCGNKFETSSTFGKEVIGIEVCSQCHPFYTGKQKIMDSAGQVDKFRKRFKR